MDIIILNAPAATAQNAPTPVAPVTTAAAAEATDDAADADDPAAITFPDSVDYEYVYHRLQRLNLNAADMPTPELWRQTVGALEAAKELIRATLELRRTV